MRLLDLYCGEGGAAMGYHQAGFDEIVGVDIKPQPRYPFAFIRANAVEDLSPKFLQSFDAIHASPPCQFGTELNADRSRHLNLIPDTRKLLLISGLPFAIENVRGVRAHLHNPVSLFGTMFGNRCRTSSGQEIVLSRERLFECNWHLRVPEDPGTGGLPIGGVYGGHLRVRSKGFRTGKGTGRTVDLPGEDRASLARELMGMPWATMQGMSEAVPPSYTKWVGERLLCELSRRA